jgi:hypothetical protein
MPRNLRITLAILSVAVIIGLISLRSLQHRMQHLVQTPTTEEQARRDLLKPPISTPSDVEAQTKLFWADGPEKVAPTQVVLPLSADPAKRARQVIDALILQAPTPEERTLPADATLLGFYILPDGTAVADFSDTLTSGMPSGILSEQQAVDSIARTVESNVKGLRRLKILIHGQEVDTLAGHVDLTGFFDLNSAMLSAPQNTPAQASPQNAKPSATLALPATNPIAKPSH